MKNYLSHDVVLADLLRTISKVPSIKQWCKDKDLSYTAVLHTTSGARKVSEPIARALGYEPVKVYIRMEKKDYE